MFCGAFSFNICACALGFLALWLKVQRQPYMPVAMVYPHDGGIGIADATLQFSIFSKTFMNK